MSDRSTWKRVFVRDVYQSFPEMGGRQISAYLGELARKGLYAPAEGGGAKWWGRVLVKPQPKIESEGESQ